MSPLSQIRRVCRSSLAVSMGPAKRRCPLRVHSFEERWCACVFERLEVATQRALDDLLMTGDADDDTDAEATETRRSGLNE